MGEEIDNKRVMLVVKELYRFELELASSNSRTLTERELDELLRFVLTRPHQVNRLQRHAIRLLNALSANKSTPSMSKPSLTGEALWQSIVESSKP